MNYHEFNQNYNPRINAEREGRSAAQVEKTYEFWMRPNTKWGRHLEIGDRFFNGKHFEVVKEIRRTRQRVVVNNAYVYDTHGMVSLGFK